MIIDKLVTRIEELDLAVQKSITQHHVLIGQLHEAKLILEDVKKSELSCQKSINVKNKK